MSAGATVGPVVDNSLVRLAPKCREAVEWMIASANTYGLDAYVYEAHRSAELQAMYYRRGRPPTAQFPRTVTNARSNLYSWHAFGLATDVISRAKGWGQPPEWFAELAVIGRQCGLKWGGDWKQRDYPHFQWGRCKPSPSDVARQILREQGLGAVWAAVGAA